MAYFPRLSRAMLESRMQREMSGNGTDLQCDALDEDIDIHRQIEDVRTA